MVLYSWLVEDPKAPEWGPNRHEIYRDAAGNYHREEGPAISHPNGATKHWYKHGLRHRLDGPAVEGVGYNEWYIDGVEMTEEEFNAATNQLPPTEARFFTEDELREAAVEYKQSLTNSKGELKEILAWDASDVSEESFDSAAEGEQNWFDEQDQLGEDSRNQEGEVSMYEALQERLMIEHENAAIGHGLSILELGKEMYDTAMVSVTDKGRFRTDINTDGTVKHQMLKEASLDSLSWKIEQETPLQDMHYQQSIETVYDLILSWGGSGQGEFTFSDEATAEINEAAGRLEPDQKATLVSWVKELIHEEGWDADHVSEILEMGWTKMNNTASCVDQPDFTKIVEHYHNQDWMGLKALLDTLRRREQEDIAHIIEEVREVGKDQLDPAILGNVIRALRSIESVERKLP